MHDVLRTRVLRHLEALPEQQLYQVVDYIEFLASKYARDQVRPASGMQKFGEILEDKMRAQGVAVRAIKGTLGVVGSAERFFSGLTEAGKSLAREVETGVRSIAEAPADPPEGEPRKALPPPERQGDGDPGRGNAAAG